MSEIENYIKYGKEVNRILSSSEVVFYYQLNDIDSAIKSDTEQGAELSVENLSAWMHAVQNGLR